MRKFQVVAGSHRRVDRANNRVQVFKKGMIVASEEDLTEKFKNSFVEVPSDRPESYAKKEPFKMTPKKATSEGIPVEVLQPSGLSSVTIAPPAPEESAEAKEPSGKDMTDRYPEAVKAGYGKVMKMEDKTYRLYTDDGEFESFASQSEMKDHLAKTKPKKSKK